MELTTASTFDLLWRWQLAGRAATITGNTYGNVRENNMKMSSASVATPPVTPKPATPSLPKARRRLSWKAKGWLLALVFFVIGVLYVLDANGDEPIDTTFDPAKKENYTETVTIQNGTSTEQSVPAFPFKEQEQFKVGLKPKTINVEPGTIILNAHGGSFIVTAVERHGAGSGGSKDPRVANPRGGASSFTVCTVAKY